MIDATALFKLEYQPKKLLAFYTVENGGVVSAYVESFDICPRKRKAINPHPLEVEEARLLAAIMAEEGGIKDRFLNPKGLLPPQVLRINHGADGSAIWYTPPGPANLFFTPQLGIPNGKAQLPALVWKATKDKLRIFALHGGKRPALTTPLYHAPFFNTFSDGRVCMGTVDCQIPKGCRLEGFISCWQSYFWGSYFSHSVEGFSPLAENLICFWKDHMPSGSPFPVDKLLKTGLTLQNILS